MRSLWYLLSGKPGNVDDCIDLSKKSRVELVTLSLGTEENVTEMYVMKRLFGTFDWKFENNNIAVVQVFSGYLLTDSEPRKKKNITAANRRMQNIVDKIERHKIAVVGKENKFNYSIINHKEG